MQCNDTLHACKRLSLPRARNLEEKRHANEFPEERCRSRNRRRKQIVEAAIAEFQEKGYSGASMDGISERARVSKRTVYNHFDSKETLFRAINQRLADRVNTGLEFAYDPRQPIREGLMALGWIQGELLLQPDFISLARLITSETIRHPDLAKDLNKPHRQDERLFRFHAGGG